MFYLDDLERTALFIDGPGLYRTVKGLDFEMDFKKTLDYFKNNSRLVQARYLTSVRESPPGGSEKDYNPIKPVIDYLKYNGWSVFVKKCFILVDAAGANKVIGDSILVQLTVDVLTMLDRLDHVVLFAHDRDLVPLSEAIRRVGVRLTVVGSRKASPIISDDLREGADQFVELAEVGDLLGKPPRSLV